MKDSRTISLLEEAYAAELETVQNYLANSVWLDGLGAVSLPLNSTFVRHP